MIIRALVDEVLDDMSREFDRLYPTIGSPVASGGPGSAIDARPTRHAGDAMSQHAGRVEPAFGWLQTIDWLRKVNCAAW